MSCSMCDPGGTKAEDCRGLTHPFLCSQTGAGPLHPANNKGKKRPNPGQDFYVCVTLQAAFLTQGGWRNGCT